MALDRLTKITGPGVSTDTNWVGNNANFTGITTTATSFNVGVTTIHSNLAEVHNIKSTGIITATGGSFSGNVTAVDGTFSGNVSIAGTLTYEDVTNIDSIGIVTARNGIDCNGDIDVDGHTNLDNVSVAGVSTFTGLVDINGGATVNGGLTSTLLTINGGANPATINHTGGNALTLARGGKEISFNANYAASNSYASMSVTSGMDFRFTVGGRDGITIDGSNGYMGIDTQAPTAPLHIASNSAALKITRGTKTFTFNANYAAGDSYMLAQLTSGMDLKFNLGGADRINFKSAGHIEPHTDSQINLGANLKRFANVYSDNLFAGGEVLIGTTTDANIKLDVEGSLRAKSAGYVAPASGTGLEIYYATNTLNDAPSGYLISYDRSSSAYKKINYDASEHKFRTSGTERLRIASDGKVGINQASPRTTLDVNGYVFLGNGQQIQITGSSGAKGLQLIGQDDGTSLIGTMGSSGEHLLFRTASSEKMRLLVGGPHLLLGGTSSVYEITETSGHAGMVIGNTSLGNAGLAIINSTSGTGRIYFGDATANNAGRNRGMINYYHSSDYMMFATAGSEKLRIDSGGDVTVSTGTLYIPQWISHVSDPDSKFGFLQPDVIEFQVAGTQRLKIMNTGQIRIDQATSANNGIRMRPSGWNYDFRMGAVSSSGGSIWLGQNYEPTGGTRDSATYGTNYLRFTTQGEILLGTGATDTNPTERMKIKNDGKIGINESNPQQQLHVHDDNNYKGILINGNSAPRIAFARSTTTTGEWSVGIDGTNGNNFCINRSNDNSNRLFVIGNGQTNSNQNTAIIGVLFNNDIRSTTATNDDSTSNVKISARNAAAGHGNYCIIGVSGNTYFGAGANSYSSNPSGNNINGGTTIRVYGGISSNAYNDAHRFGRNTDGSILLFQSAGGTEGSIAISGSTTNYNTSSDYRLKENIVNITDGITKLKQLKPRRFNFIKDPSITRDGFIAHEVDSIVPEAVIGTKDETFSKDDEVNNIKAGDPKYQQMDASKLIPLLTAALQEAITEIETLKTKVAALEGS